jgi:hypothetical protein
MVDFSLLTMLKKYSQILFSEAISSYSLLLLAPKLFPALAVG